MTTSAVVSPAPRAVSTVLTPPMMPSVATPAKPFQRIMLCVTEDWFALSHFQPLIRVLVTLAGEVLVVARSSGRAGEIEALGARFLDFDYKRGTLAPLQEAQTARNLAAVISAFKPDAIHLIAMKSILLGGFAQRLAPVPHTVVHMTGLGYLGVTQTPKMKLFRWVLQKHVAWLMSRPGSWLLIENTDDLAFLRAGGSNTAARHTVLGGAGIDPLSFPVQPTPDNAVPSAAYVGRMISSKGVDVLMQAAGRLRQRGVPLTLDLYGHSDDGNPEAIPEAALHRWSDEGLGRWHGPTRDVAGVWRRTDIYVTPTRGGEGLPRSLLEAAASGRPAIVTDVAGCRSFVRHGIEGLIVPPDDAGALAAALEQLACDPELRLRMGRAARARVLDGYTIPQVSEAYAQSYRAMAAGHDTGTR